LQEFYKTNDCGYSFLSFEHPAPAILHPEYWANTTCPYCSRANGVLVWPTRADTLDPYTATILYAAAAVGSLGLLSFLLYSELRFGHWNLYFSYVAQAWSSATGSGLEMNPIAILSKFRWPDPQT